MSVVTDLIRLARPQHWVKSGFIALPIPFAVAAGSSLELNRLGLGIAGFTLLASAVYVFNDILDAVRDREHPRKKSRPIAAGRVGRTLAFGWCLLLLGSGFALLIGCDRPQVPVLASAYIAINLFYTVLGKHVALVDVFLLASGFVIRVLIGCALIGAAPSEWLLLCTSTIALFLALTKRRADLASGVDAEHRPSLADYSIEFIDQALGITSALALISYALYCKDSLVLRPNWEFASVPLVAFGFLNYLRLLRREPEWTPIERLFRQPSHAINFALWLIVVWSSLDLRS